MASQSEATRDSDSEDDIPLARLRKSKTNEDYNSDNDSYIDSDNDPEFKPGICEVRRCKEDVWAACDDCEILVCYDHFMEEVTSCENHGKVEKSYKRKSNQTCEVIQIKETRMESDNHDLHDTIVIGERHEMDQGGDARGIETGREELMIRVEPEGAGLAMGEQREERQNESVRGRKRTRNEENWARNVKKRLKNAGKPYISAKGKEIAGKAMKESCSEKCALKCSQKFNEEERRSLFEGFWASADRRDQHNFLLRHAEELPVKRKRVGAEKRSTTFHYYFHKSDATKDEVCRTFFINTLDIKWELVYKVLRRKSNTGMLRPNLQGKHGNQKRTEETLLQGVKDHINSFQTVDSHYCRARTGRQYLDSFLSVAEMYRLYSNQCDERGMEKVSADKYRKVFDYDFNLGFHRPKKDQCELCTAQKNRKGYATDEENQDYESHMKNKITARQKKDNAKTDATNSTTMTACAFDLEQILLCPHGQSSAFFYKRRLGVYNLTVYDYKNGDAFCYMWPESEGRRGSNEVATCLFKYIDIQSRKGVKDIILFSDNCAGQNRNRFVAFALNFSRAYFNLNSVRHIFLEKGHTETENDSVHATIERKVRHIEIYSPEQWYTAVRTARTSKQPYIVNEMINEDFIDFKAMASKVRNLALDDSGEKIPWSKVREVLATADDSSALYIKTSYDCQPQRLDMNRRKRVSGGAIDACNVQLFKGMPKPGIPELKKRDLLTLCNSGQIPTGYRAFYNSLCVGGETEDSASED